MAASVNSVVRADEATFTCAWRSTSPQPSVSPGPLIELLETAEQRARWSEAENGTVTNVFLFDGEGCSPWKALVTLRRCQCLR